MPDLIDLFVIGAIVHFCLLGLHLVRYIEREQPQMEETAEEIRQLREQLDEMAEALMRESGAGIICTSESTQAVLAKYLRAVNG